MEVSQVVEIHDLVTSSVEAVGDGPARRARGAGCGIGRQESWACSRLGMVGK